MTGFLRLLLALSFLSRLVPAQDAEEDDIAASLVWYPAAGFCLGLVLVLPFALGLGGGKPLLQGALFVIFSAWLTRALHWDGWADLFDATGSGKHGEEYRKILKDSRLGAFGAVAIVCGILVAVISAGECLARGAWAPLLWAVTLGRCLVSPLAIMGSFPPWSTLGKIISPGADGVSLAASAVFAVALGAICCGFTVMLLGIGLSAIGVCMFARLANREGGLNGDYLGAVIIWGELSALICAAVFG